MLVEKIIHQYLDSLDICLFYTLECETQQLTRMASYTWPYQLSTLWRGKIGKEPLSRACSQFFLVLHSVATLFPRALHSDNLLGRHNTLATRRRPWVVLRLDLLQ